MRKVLLVSFLLLNNAVSFASGVFERTVLFVNCTNRDVQVTNPKDPYKFSLSAQRAGNGYSPRVNFIVPKEVTLYKYPVHLTGYYNIYTDGAMHVSFSGGVDGKVYFEQTYSVPRHVEVQATSSSPDVEVIPFFFADTARDKIEPLLIILGCGKGK